MPWEIPITFGKTTYPVRFNTEGEPTQADIDEAIAIIRQQREAPQTDLDKALALIRQQQENPQPDATGQGRLSSAASNVGRGALSVIPGTIGGVGYVTGSDTLTGAAKDVEQGIEKMLPVNPAYQEEFSQKAANVLGQAGGMFLTGGAAGAIGKGRALAKGLEAAAAAAKGTKAAQAASLGTGILQGTYSGGQEAEKYGMTGGSAYARALLGGALEGATEKYLFGMGTELAPVRKFLGDTVERGVGGILKATGTEAGEEAASQIGGNIATTALAPKGVVTPDVMSGVGEAALLGGIAGGALGGVNNLMLGSQDTAETPPESGATEPKDPLVANLNAAIEAATANNTGEEVTVEDLVQTAKERFGVLQTKAADQTTPLTQEEADEMDALTTAFTDPTNIDHAGLADLYNLRITEPVADEVAPVAPVEDELTPAESYRLDALQEIKDRLRAGEITVSEYQQEVAQLEKDSAAAFSTPEELQYLEQIQPLKDRLVAGEITIPEYQKAIEEIKTGVAPAPVVPAATAPVVPAATAPVVPAPVADPIIDAAVVAVNKPDANLPIVAALVNDGALNPAPIPTPTEPPANAPTQEREVESPSGTPPVQGQPADQGANRQAPEGTAQREGEGAEVAPAPAPIERKKIDAIFERILKRKSTVPLINGMFQVPYAVALKDPSLRPTNRNEQSLRYRTSTKGEVTGDFNASDSRDTIIFDERVRGARAPVAPVEVAAEKEQLTPEKGDEVFVKGGDARITRRIDNIFTAEGKQMVLLQGLRDPIPLENTTVDPKSDYRRRKQKKAEQAAPVVKATPQLVRQMGDIAVKNRTPIDQRYVEDYLGGLAPEGYALNEKGDLYIYSPSRGPQFSQGGQANTAQDTEYLELAKNPEKNRSLLQKMVDKAAKMAGYNVGPVYHGTAPSSWKWDDGLKLFGVFGRDWTAFNGPAYFAANKTYADAFASHRSGERALGNDPITLSVMLSGKFKDMRSVNGFWKELRNNPKTLIESASSEGFTGFILTEADTSKRPEWAGDIYFVFNPNQIKSADPVTYDAAGNVIPLSQRFNEATPDIRFSQAPQTPTRNQSPESLRHAELEAKFKAGTITPEETAEAEKLVADRSEKGGWNIAAKHGTTHNFFTFTRANANIENNLGAGFYLSNTEDDVTENYAGVGPDLTNRIEKRAEQILNDLEDQPAYGTPAYKKKMEAAKKKAAKELSGGKQRVISAKVRFTNPVILDGNGARPSGTIIELAPDIEQYRAEAIERVKENNPEVTDENIDAYSDEVQDAMYELQSEDYNADGPMEKIRGVVDSFEETDWGRLSEELSGEESLPAYRLEQLLRENEGTAYATDSESGDSAVGELIRQVFEALGYDGIIDKNVNAKFGSKSKGKPMAGMRESTIHYIAFDPNQIKSAETFTGVPLDQRFDPKSEDIRFSQAPQTPTGLPAAKVKTVVDQVMAKNKSPLQVRVITRDELDNADEFQDIRDSLQSQGADSQFTEAWVDGRTQTVVVVADSFSSAARVREVLVHEIIGHAGVDAFASEADISRVLKILDRRVPDLVNQVRARYPNLDDAGIAREVIAKFSEQYQSADFASQPSGVKALWRELKAWLGSILQRLNVSVAAFDDLTLHWFYTNAVNAAAGITALPAPTVTATAAPVAATAAPVAATAAPVAATVAPVAATVAPAPTPAATAPTAAPAPAAKKKFVLPPARPRAKTAPAEAENAFGVANAVVDAARAKLGLPPVYAPARQSFGTLWDRALRALSIDPKKGEKLVAELNEKPREISDVDTAILTHELVTRTLDFDRATEALNKATESEKEAARQDYDSAMTRLQEAWNASDVSGTEQGRSLNARKMLVALDYTLSKMVSMRTAAAERPLTDAQRIQTEELYNKIDALQKKLDELEKSGKTSGEEARLEDLLASAREEGKLEAQKEAKLLAEADAILKAEEAARASKVKKGADPAKVLEDSVDAARARLRARKGLFGAKTPEVAQEEAGDIKFSIADAGIVGLSAQDIADLTLVGKSYIAEGASTLESWSEKMVAEFGEDITEYLEPLYETSKAPVAAAPAAKAAKAPKAAPAAKAPKEKKLKASPMARVKADAKEGKELSPKLIYELVKQKLEEGISGVENVFKAVTKDLQEEFPLMTEREVRDIFSGYGKAKFPSQEELAKKVRELRRLSQLTSALEDAKAFIVPLRSGQQRDPVSDAIRDIQKEITRIMQENNLVQATTSKQIKSTLDSIKTRLKNQITDLNVQIKKKEKAPKKAGVVYDQEANDLRAKRNRLQEILDGIVGPSQPSPSQRIRQRVNQLQKEITDLEKKVATRDISRPSSQPVPETQLIQVLKDQRDALREQLHVIRVEIEGEPSLTQEQVNERAVKAIQRNIDDLTRRIQEQDFSKKSGNVASGPIIDQLRAQQEALREQYDILRETIQGKREKTDQQKIKMANDALDKSIEELQRQIDTGDTAAKPKGAPIVTPNLTAKRAQRDALIAVRKGMRDAVKAALADPVAKQLARDKKNITRQIEKLRTKIANRDFSKPTKIAHTTDNEKRTLEVKLNMLKADWAKILFNEKLANRTTTQKLIGGGAQTLNTARAVLTSFDFSGVLRQGGFIVFANPLRAIRNLGSMIASFRSLEAATKAKIDLENRPNFNLYKRSKLFLADISASSAMVKQEEAYASLWVDKIPKLLGGGLIRGSQRAYVTFLNNLRADSFDAMMLGFRKGPVATEEEINAISKFINIATGRGDLGKFSQAAEGLNTVFFAPRLVASRFQLLLGMPYFSASGRTKNLVLQEYAKFLTGIAIVYMLGMLAQEDEDKPIETDPRSTNFGKIRFGNSRVDPLSGLQQVTVLLARLTSGQTKTATGKIIDIRGEKVPYGGATPVSLISKFARSKFSPVLGSVTNMLQGENVIGEKVTTFGEAQRMVIPMSFGEVRKIMEEQGIPKGMALSTLALFGMGVQTYDETKKR